MDGSGSTDLDGDPLTFAWRFVSKPEGSAATFSDPTAVKPTFVVDRPGQYTLELTVNDGTVNSTPDQIVISTQNSAPVADAGDDQTVPVGTWVTLDGSLSRDNDGDQLTCLWTLRAAPDGSSSSPGAAGDFFTRVDFPSNVRRGQTSPPTERAGCRGTLDVINRHWR